MATVWVTNDWLSTATPQAGQKRLFSDRSLAQEAHWAIDVVYAVIVKAALCSRCTEFVARNVTGGGGEHLSSRLVGEMLERQMRLTDDYWKAFEHWKSNRPLAGAGAGERMSREAVRERR